jgi:hypothetical protein
MARGGARGGGHSHGAQTGPAHDHDDTGLGAPVLEPSAATKREIERRRSSILRFWGFVAAASAAFIPYVWWQEALEPSRLPLTALMGATAAALALFGYLQYCKVNLLTLYEKGIAPPAKPGFSLDRRMDVRFPFTDFARVEVEDNDIDRKELAEHVYFRFVFHYPSGARLTLLPSILGRDPSREQLTSFFGALKEALGSSIPDRVELRKVFPDGRRPAVAVSSRALRVRVGGELREFRWDAVSKLRLRPARPGTGRSFEMFDVLVGGRWQELDAARIPEIKKADLLTFIEEVLRIARSMKVEILQEKGA